MINSSQKYFWNTGKLIKLAVKLICLVSFLFSIFDAYSQDWFYREINLNKNEDILRQHNIVRIEVLDSMNSIGETFILEKGKVVKHVKSFFNSPFLNDTTYYEYYEKGYLKSSLRIRFGSHDKFEYILENPSIIKKYLILENGEKKLQTKFFLNARNGLYKTEDYLDEDNLFMIKAKYEDYITTLYITDDSIHAVRTNLIYQDGKLIGTKDELGKYAETFDYNSEGLIVSSSYKYYESVSTTKYSYNRQNLVGREVSIWNGQVGSIRVYLYY